MIINLDEVVPTLEELQEFSLIAKGVENVLFETEDPEGIDGKLAQFKKDCDDLELDGDSLMNAILIVKMLYEASKTVSEKSVSEGLGEHDEG